jgi:glycosyltransferase involved in cell wall biosynthesis
VRPRDGRRLRGGPALKPVLFVTNHAPPFRVGAFAKLHEREDVTFALIGGDVRHGGGPGEAEALPFPVIRPRQHEVAALAHEHRAVIAGLSGRVAPLAAYLGARRARVPYVLWASLWAHPRTLPHAASYLPVRHLYRHADAIVTYGPHVSAYVRAKGARSPVLEAPQSVENEYWNGQSPPIRRAPFQAAFVGRMAGEKGPQVLIQAWSSSGLSALSAALVLVGGGPIRARAVATGAVLFEGPRSTAEVRNFYAGSDVVVVPSVPTRDFREPWGLVVNEAFNQGVPVIASDAVGAVAGGLVRHERTGLVVPAGDVPALASALRRMHDDPALRARLGTTAREAVKAYTHDAWAAGVSSALAAVGKSRC